MKKERSEDQLLKEDRFTGQAFAQLQPTSSIDQPAATATCSSRTPLSSIVFYLTLSPSLSVKVSVDVNALIAIVQWHFHL